MVKRLMKTFKNMLVFIRPQILKKLSRAKVKVVTGEKTAYTLT